MSRINTLIALIVIFCCRSVTADAQKAIPFGGNNQLIINTATGLFSVKYSGKFIVTDASAAFTTGEGKYQTADYPKHTLSLKKISDKLGAGCLVTLTSARTGAPTMAQRFYCYTGKPFIVTELEISGQNLRSNYMAPVITTKADVYAGKELQTLFMPYDNDTFIRYRSKNLNDTLNISSEVGLIYDNSSRKGLVLASLTHDSWKSGVESGGTSSHITDLKIWGGLNELQITRDSMAHGALKGDKILSPKVFLGYFADWRAGMEIYAKTSSTIEGRYVKPWTKATPIGWNSWGVIAEHINYEKATAVTDFFDKQLPKFRNQDGTAYIDLDSFWDNMVRGGLNGDVSKLKDFVKYCTDRHLVPGVYWAPFTDWGFRSKNDRKAEGSDYKFSEMWTKTDKGYHDLDGGRALDPTHPGTQKRIAFVLGKLKECGFKMIKIDFLGHGAAESSGFYDPNVTTGMQAYKVGMQTIVDVLDNSMLLYAAISPSLATARYVNMRRIACDSWRSMKDVDYTLNSVTYGWWQTYLYDYIDADHLVFEKETLGANRARLVSGLVTGSVILGDDYSKDAPWQQQVKEWLQRPGVLALIKNGKAFKPVDGGTDNHAAPVFIRKDASATYVAVFNYKRQAAAVSLNTQRLGLIAGKKYQFTNLLDGSVLSTIGKLDINFKEEGGNIYRITQK